MTSIRTGLLTWLGQQLFCSGQQGKHGNHDFNNQLFQNICDARGYGEAAGVRKNMELSSFVISFKIDILEHAFMLIGVSHVEERRNNYRSRS